MPQNVTVETLILCFVIHVVIFESIFTEPLGDEVN